LEHVDVIYELFFVIAIFGVFFGVGLSFLPQQRRRPTERDSAQRHNTLMTYSSPYNIVKLHQVYISVLFDKRCNEEVHRHAEAAELQILPRLPVREAVT
jgi:hypothetical protein